MAKQCLRFYIIIPFKGAVKLSVDRIGCQKSVDNDIKEKRKNNELTVQSVSNWALGEPDKIDLKSKINPSKSSNPSSWKRITSYAI